LIAPADDDRSLAIAAANGDRHALDTLLRRHIDRLHALCRRLVGPTDADDALQDSLIAIVRGLARFDGQAAFSTWAFRVTTNRCLDELRRRKRRPEPVDNVYDAISTASVESSVVAKVDVDNALAHLPDEYRAAVVLRDVCELDYREIGEVLGIPAGTVRSRIARGRAALASLLSNDATQRNRDIASSVETGDDG